MPLSHDPCDRSSTFPAHFRPPVRLACHRPGPSRPPASEVQKLQLRPEGDDDEPEEEHEVEHTPPSPSFNADFTHGVARCGDQWRAGCRCTGGRGNGRSALRRGTKRNQRQKVRASCLCKTRRTVLLRLVALFTPLRPSTALAGVSLTNDIIRRIRLTLRTVAHCAPLVDSYARQQLTYEPNAPTTGHPTSSMTSRSES